jgi:hypothetical protein
MRRFFAAAVGSAVALAGFAGAANASATIDLIWANGTNTIRDVGTSSTLTLSVILTAGPLGSAGAGVSADYSAVVGKLGVLGYLSTPSGPLPVALGSTTNTGSRIENISSVCLCPFVGTGLLEGQSHQLGTITFHKDTLVDGTFEIRSDALGPLDAVLDLSGAEIQSTTTFNSAILINVPEPGALSMLVLGLAGLMLAGRGRRS